MLYQNIFKIFRGFDLDISSMILKDIFKIYIRTHLDTYVKTI
jgi:hypothetical protein